MNTIKFSTLISLVIFTTVLGCGPLPSGQERVLRFTVNNVKPVLPMVHTDDLPSRSNYPNVSLNAAAAQTFVYEVLEQQGHSAGLSNAVISAILDQLNINIIYQPLKCDTLSSVSNAAQAALRMDSKENCLVVGDAVSSICTMMAMPQCVATIKAVPQQHSTISGTISIANVIMAGWSDQTWRIVLNRVVRVLSSRPSGTNFATASVDIV